MCILTDWWKARALTWNYCFRNSDKYGSNVKLYEIFSQWKIQWFSCRIFTCGVKSRELFIETFIETFTVSESFDESFNENFTTFWHHTWKFGVKIRQDDISKTRYRYIENFDISATAGDTIRYDTMYRYRIDVSIFSIYRSITILFICLLAAATGHRLATYSWWDHHDNDFQP